MAATVTGTGHGAGPGDRLTLNVKARCRGQGPGPTVTVGHGTADFSSLAATTDSEVLYCTGSWAGEFPDCGQTLIDFLPANGEEVLHRGNGDSDAAGARTAQPAIGISAAMLCLPPSFSFVPSSLLHITFSLPFKGPFLALFLTDSE